MILKLLFMLHKTHNFKHVYYIKFVCTYVVHVIKKIHFIFNYKAVIKAKNNLNKFLNILENIQICSKESYLLKRKMPSKPYIKLNYQTSFISIYTYYKFKIFTKKYKP